MKFLYHLYFSVLITCLSFHNIYSQNDLITEDEIELTESVPVETGLDRSVVSRTADVWIKMINDAKESIFIETFYFATEKGEPLDEIIVALKNAAKREVIVRIIIDSSFYSRSSERSSDVLEGIENIEIRKIPMGRIAGGVMHAKYFIVDKENLFIGSQNMDWRALKHIHEMGIRIKNKKLAETFAELFETDWNLCGDVFSNQIYGGFSNSLNPVTLNTNEYGTVVVYPAFSPVKLNTEVMNSEETELLKIIANTKDSLLIQIYSYSPKAKNDKNYYDTIDNALRDAASRGVKIKIVLPDWSVKENSIQFIKELSQVNNISIKFITIPQYSGGFIPYSRVDHCKYFTSDNDISWISTSNWEWGYFYNSRNATLIINNDKLNSDLSNVFNEIWYGQYTVPVDINKEYVPVKKN